MYLSHGVITSAQHLHVPDATRSTQARRNFKPSLSGVNYPDRSRSSSPHACQADQTAALRSIISAWVRLALFECMTQGEGDKRLWFIVDEIDARGTIDGLTDAPDLNGLTVRVNNCVGEAAA